MVGMGSRSSSGIPSEVGTSSGSSLAPLLWGSLGITALLVGVSGAIVALPDPTTTQQPYGRPKMKTSDEAAKDAKKRLEKWHHEQANKYKYHLKDSTLNPDQKKYAQKKLREHQEPVMLSSLEASKAAHARLARSAGADKAKPRRGKGWGSKSSPPPSARWKMGAEYVQYRDSKCEDERSFLLDLLTDRQLNEFMEYIERDEEDDGEYYRAETLKKNSCCCGATVINPCACMIEGVMDCSAVEPKCPCYEWPSNVNSPIELDNYESKCPRCKTDLTEEWWDEVHDEELGDWEVEEGGRAKFYRTWYGNCPSCRSYLELPDYNYDHGESMAGWEPSYINRAELEEYVPEEMIPVGSKVRSYDFWPYDQTCYKEGVIVDHAPSPSCSPNCLHYHIRTTKVVRRGKLHSEEKGEIFMTHPYADIFDQEYSGQLSPHIQIIFPAWVK